MAATSGTYLKYSAVGGGGGGGSAGIKSINTDTTPAQLFVGANGIGVATVSGTTTITGSTAAGSGTVTAVSVATSSGFFGNVASSNSAPIINIGVTAFGILAGSSGGTLSSAASSSFPTLNQNTTGTAANVTGTVGIGNGGTGQTSFSAGLLRSSGAALSSAELSSDVATSGSNVTTVVAIQGFATTATYSVPPQEFNAGTGNGGSININWASGAAQRVLVTGGFSFSLSGGVIGGQYQLKLTQNGSNTILWPSCAFCWASSTMPTFSSTSGQVDLVSIYYDGSIYRASASLGYPF